MKGTPQLAIELSMDDLFLLPNKGIQVFQQDSLQLNEPYHQFNQPDFLREFLVKEPHRIKIEINDDAARTQLLNHLFTVQLSAFAQTNSSHEAQLSFLIDSIRKIFDQNTLSNQQIKSFLALLAQQLRGLPRAIVQSALDKPFSSKLAADYSSYTSKLNLTLFPDNRIQLTVKDDVFTFCNEDEIHDLSMTCIFTINKAGQAQISPLRFSTDSYIIPALIEECFTDIKRTKDEQKAENQKYRDRYYSNLVSRGLLTPSPSSRQSSTSPLSALSTFRAERGSLTPSPTPALSETSSSPSL